ncbi:hypothetical protein, partial [Pseudomonas sp. SIMBA_067]|uniref:hypothetical protein n=1 Tax=Pseudomonas sp. SIMBA_067 TaxID=3085807 RepID=UPI00397B2155
SASIFMVSEAKAELAKIEADVDFVKVHAYLLENNLELSGDAKELEDFVEKVSSEAKEVRALLEATDKSLASIAEEL